MVVFAIAAASISAPSLVYTQGGDVWRIGIEGGAKQKIVGGLVYDRPVEASPDGRYVIVWDHAAGHWDLVRVEIATGTKLNLTSRIDGGCRMPSYSPDGKKIAFMCDEPAGLYIMNWDGSGQKKLTSKGFRDAKPQWSRDGKSLLYSELTEQGFAMNIVKIDGTGERSLGYGVDPVFDPSGKGVVYTKNEAVLRLDLKTSKSQSLFPGAKVQMRLLRYFGDQLMYVHSAPGGGEVVQWKVFNVWSKGIRDVVIQPGGARFALQDDESLRIVNKQFYPKTIVKGTVGGVAWL